MAREEATRRLVLEGSALGDRVDLRAHFQARQLERQLEHARFRAEHLRQLDLPRVEVEPAPRIGQHLAREDADRKLVAFAQALGQGRADIAAA